MNTLSYEEVDAIAAGLRHRSDLRKYVPHGQEMLSEVAYEFWLDVLTCMVGGRWADAITEIERRFEPRDKTPWYWRRAIASVLGRRVAA